MKPHGSILGAQTGILFFFLTAIFYSTAANIYAEKEDLSSDYIFKASRLFEEGDINGAIEVLSPHIDVLDNNALMLLGNAFREKLDYANAEMSFRSILNREPNFVDARFALAEILYSQGRYRHAIEQYSEAARYTDHPLPEYKKLLSLYLAGDDESAQELVNNVRFSMEHPAYYYFHAAKEFFNGNPDKGLYFVRSAQQFYSTPNNLVFLRPLWELSFLTQSELFPK